MNNNLTKKQAEKYFELCGCVCPFCDSDDINSGHAEFDEDYAWRNATCSDCGKTWQDEYRLTVVLQKFEDGDDIEFKNTELIKELAKPAKPNYYNLAWNHARKNGWELLKTISKYSVCKKSENEWCVHTITNTCLDDEDNGIDTEDGAIQSALLKVFVDDLSSTCMVKIDDNIVYFGFSNDTFHAEWEDDRGTYEVNLQFDCIDLIRNLGIGHWSITSNNETYEIKFFILSPNGAEL